MAMKVFKEYQGVSVKIDGICYNYIGEVTEAVNTYPFEIEGTFDSCLACDIESSSSTSSASSESEGNVSSSLSSVSRSSVSMSSWSNSLSTGSESEVSESSESGDGDQQSEVSESSQEAYSIWFVGFDVNTCDFSDSSATWPVLADGEECYWQIGELFRGGTVGEDWALETWILDNWTGTGGFDNIVDQHNIFYINPCSQGAPQLESREFYEAMTPECTVCDQNDAPYQTPTYQTSWGPFTAGPNTYETEEEAIAAVENSIDEYINQKCNDTGGSRISSNVVSVDRTGYKNNPNASYRNVIGFACFECGARSSSSSSQSESSASESSSSESGGDLPGPVSCPNSEPDMILTVSNAGATETIDWCGETWNLPTDNGVKKRVCASSGGYSLYTPPASPFSTFIYKEEWRNVSDHPPRYLEIQRSYNLYDNGTFTFKQYFNLVKLRDGNIYSAQRFGPATTQTFTTRSFTVGLDAPLGSKSDYRINDNQFGSFTTPGNITYTWERGDNW